MGSMFPALDVRPPESPIQQYAQVQQIVGGQQQIEAQRLQNQITQRTLQDQDAMTRAMSQWDGKDTTVRSRHSSRMRAARLTP
jgi:hypothetical protein